MSKNLNRKFTVGETVYVVDFHRAGNGGIDALAISVTILEVEENCFLASNYQWYAFEDYDRLVFDTQSEAEVVAKQLPKSYSFVYQIGEDGNILKHQIRGIWYTSRVEKTTDLSILFIEKPLNRIPIDKIGTEIFLSEESALAALKKDI